MLFSSHIIWECQKKSIQPYVKLKEKCLHHTSVLYQTVIMFSLFLKKLHCFWIPYTRDNSNTMELQMHPISSSKHGSHKQPLCLSNISQFQSVWNLEELESSLEQMATGSAFVKETDVASSALAQERDRWICIIICPKNMINYFWMIRNLVKLIFWKFWQQRLVCLRLVGLLFCFVCFVLFY